MRLQELRKSNINGDPHLLYKGVLVWGIKTQSTSFMFGCLYVAGVLPDCVVQSAGPEFGTVRGDIDAGGAIGMSLELAHQRLVVKIPNCYVAIRTTAEAYLKSYIRYILL